MSWQDVWETPPHSLEQIRAAMLGLCDDIDHAIITIASTLKSGGDLDGPINGFVYVVNSLFYGALCNWGMPDRISAPLWHCLTPLRRVGIHRRESNGHWQPNATVIVQAGSASQQALVSLLADEGVRPEFRKATPFKRHVEKSLRKATPFTRKELDRAVPPSCERLQRAIIKYLNKFVAPADKRLESTWKGRLSRSDLDSLKSRSYITCGPETGVTYCELFRAMKKFTPQLRHVDIREIVKPLLSKDATVTADCVDAAVEKSTHDLRFWGATTYPGVGVWREAIVGLIETGRVAVSVVMCGDDDASKTEGRNTPEVVFRVASPNPVADRQRVLKVLYGWNVSGHVIEGGIGRPEPHAQVPDYLIEGELWDVGFDVRAVLHTLESLEYVKQTNMRILQGIEGQPVLWRLSSNKVISVTWTRDKGFVRIEVAINRKVVCVREEAEHAGTCYELTKGGIIAVEGPHASDPGPVRLSKATPPSADESDAAIDDKPPPKFAHSEDYRSVRWDGNVFPFTGNQAACVRVWWETHVKGVPDIGDETVLERAGVENSVRIRDVFKDKGRKHSAWGTMIVEGKTKATHRLNVPEGVSLPL